MNLDEIPAGASVLIDTNILIYSRRRKSEQCRRVLERCEQGEITGILTSLIVAEFCHRRMMQEAQGLGLIASNPARALSEKPAVVRQLSIYAEEVRMLIESELAVLHLERQDFLLALQMQKQHGLLTNDSLNLALAWRHGIKEIATAEAAFDSIQELLVYKVDDITP
jgi:predicted nucleic acid-binding protein